MKMKIGFICPASRSHKLIDQGRLMKHLYDCKMLAGFKELYSCVYTDRHKCLTKESCQLHMEDCPARAGFEMAMNLKILEEENFSEAGQSKTEN